MCLAVRLNDRKVETVEQLSFSSGQGYMQGPRTNLLSFSGKLRYALAINVDVLGTGH